ncbi:hypothetical protein J421_1292 [Gemmatirosa kalamazoonensis]|uniref:Outer membrane protein beta-barrel domain-containing protein n=1 Tax=Gemmatirosa kalamazoonensis TaxID=861299 RepID=W0RCK4_9BACT|nr:hypothetical protein [Gemmatirosa kalamazoonensis]AHG88829.1 hypothetical protein J421_1292 [Gemmatirosa kalamazoonensis]
MHALRLPAAALLLVPVAARAQRAAPDSLPFSPGQWGIEAGVGGGGSVGALKFLSRATALAANLAVNYNTRTTDPQLASVPVSEFSNTFVTATLGVRHYSPVARSIGALFTVGAALSRQSSHANPGDIRGHETDVGAFGEVGLSYFVLPRLTLNGTYGLTVQHQDGAQLQNLLNSQVSTVKTHGWLVQTTGVRATVGIFF